MKKKPVPVKKSRGYILASILILSTALSIISIAIFDYANNSRVNLEQQLYSRMANDAAQSGIEYAYDELDTNPYFSGIQAPTACDSTDSALAPFIVEEPLFCSTFSVTETSPGKFTSKGIVLRKTGTTFRQIAQYLFAADIPFAAQGPGGPLGPAQSTAAAFPREGMAYAENDQYIYMIGGCDPSDIRQTTVQYAPVNAIGTINAWTTTTSIPVASCNFSAAIYNNRLYITGGNDTNGLYYAPINANGSLGSWVTQANADFRSLYAHAMQIHNGYLYVTGGLYNYSSGNYRMSYAAINPTTGAVGSFTHQANWINGSEVYCSSSAIDDGRIYVHSRGKVRYGTLNANGSVSTATVTNFPTFRDCASMVAMNDYLYMFGGSSTTNKFVASLVDNIYYAQLDPNNGSIGTWTLNPSPLPEPRMVGGAFAANGYIYYLNGWNGYARSNTWVYSPL